MKFTLWPQKSLVISENEVSINSSDYGEKEKENSYHHSFLIIFSTSRANPNNFINSLTSRVRPFQLSPGWRMPVFADGWSLTKAHPWTSLLFQMSLPFVRTCDKNTAEKIINNLKCVEELHHSENLENNGRYWESRRQRILIISVCYRIAYQWINSSFADEGFNARNSCTK